MIGPTSAQLPPRDISLPKPMAAIVRIFVPVVILSLGLVLALNHRASGVEGALLALGIMAVLLGVEFALFSGAHKRRQSKLIRGLAPGEFFAGRVTMYPFGGRRGVPSAGTIFFSNIGVRFAPKREGSPTVDLPWAAVERISLGPQAGKIGVGRLVLRVHGGDSRVFSVGGYGAMASALAEHS